MDPLALIVTGWGNHGYPFQALGKLVVQSEGPWIGATVVCNTREKPRISGQLNGSQALRLVASSLNLNHKERRDCLARAVESSCCTAARLMERVQGLDTGGILGSMSRQLKPSLFFEQSFPTQQNISWI